MLSKDEEKFTQAISQMEEKLGPADIVTPSIPFGFTNYYEKEMGKNLKRKFASFEKLIPPEELADIKVWTNSIEEKMGTVKEGTLLRCINLDPGYVSMDKMVLATTKNYRHRIYLQKGIYAEVTLYWSKGSFHFFPYTYPDYRTDFYIKFFNSVMKKYRLQINTKDYHSNAK